jgi:hypothetical protein
MKSKFHAAAGALALLCIGLFWVATLVAEIFLDAGSVAAVKNAIVAAMALLIPALAATGASGFVLAQGRGGRLLQAKQRRMKFIAANGLLVLLPSAYALAVLASRGRLDGVFYAVQALELAAGALNVTLIALNMRDGARLRPG